MTYPTYREVSKAHLDLRCDITARGDCCKKNENEGLRDVGMQLVVNATDMIDGLSNQQKKVGIGVIHQWFVEALKFFGQELVSDLLPGTFVRVLQPTAKELDRDRYIGVVDSIDGDILVLQTYDENGELHDARVPHKQFVVERINGYTGIGDLRRYMTDYHSSPRLPLDLQVAHATLFKNQMQADGMMEPDKEGTPRSPGDDPGMLFEPNTDDANLDDPELQEMLRKNFGVLSPDESKEIRRETDDQRKRDKLFSEHVSNALSIAAEQGASVMHFVPTEQAFIVRISPKTGRSIIICDFPLMYGSEIVTRLKIMAKMPLDESYEVDEGFIDGIELNGVKRKLRVSTCWARRGEMALVQFIE